MWKCRSGSREMTSLAAVRAAATSPRRSSRTLMASRRRRDVAHPARRQRHAGGCSCRRPRGGSQADVPALQRLGLGAAFRRQPESSATWTRARTPSCSAAATGSRRRSSEGRITPLRRSFRTPGCTSRRTCVGQPHCGAPEQRVRLRRPYRGAGHARRKTGDWQIDALMPIYAPTGSYQEGRLGNPGSTTGRSIR